MYSQVPNMKHRPPCDSGMISELSFAVSTRRFDARDRLNLFVFFLGDSLKKNNGSVDPEHQSGE